MLEDILERGYFPAELPPPFNTETFASAVTYPLVSLPPDLKSFKRPSKCVTHNLARNGTLRRKLGIPNPADYFRIASFIETNWTALQTVASASAFSLSKPIHSASERAIERQIPIDELTLHSAKARAGSKFVLRTDISRCYPSIYTHSIPWAIHTKSIAKATRRGASLYGNEFDKLIRNAQDNQTLGIPVGPDSSFLIAELVLNTIDLSISSSGVPFQGFRYMDDYEFGFQSYSDAERALAIIQEALNEYELALNPKKTKIFALPRPIEPEWVSELRVFPFRNPPRAQQSDLFRFCDRAFQMASVEPDEAVLKYAISRIQALNISSDNLELCESLLLQCLVNEAGAIRKVLETLLKLESVGLTIDKAKFNEALHHVINTHAPLGHGSEVAWAIWGTIEFALPIDSDTAKKAVDMQDSIVWLLLLHALSKGLISSSVSFAVPKSKMKTNELFEEHWLLSYEANIKGWLSSVGSADHVSASPIFQFLKSSGVSFYDDTRRLSTVAASTIGVPSFSVAIR